jgi:glycosyltransferase involved in cell wall biosynthesis
VETSLGAEERPRVADLIPRVQLRGAEVFAQHLEVALSDRYRSRLFPLYGDAHHEQRAWIGDAAPVDISAARAGQGPLAMAPAVASLKRRVRAFAPHIVVAHGGNPLRFAAAAGLQKRAPIVYIRVAAVTPDLRTPARSASVRWAYGKVAAFVAVSGSLRDELVEVFGIPASRIRVIPNGRLRPPVATLEARAALRRSFGVGPAEVMVVWAGRFVPEKDPLAAVRLAERLQTLAPRARLVVVGGGPSDADVRAAAERSTNARLVLTGIREDAPAVIAASDLLVSTSLTEGAPGVFVEALLAGIPVVAPDMGGVRDVISERTGALVPPGDEAALASAVARLVDHDDLRLSAGAAAREAGERFDIAPVAEAYDALFTEVRARTSG